MSVNAKGTHLYSRRAHKRVGLYLGGLISGIIYSLANGLAYIRRGALKWDFTIIKVHRNYFFA